MHDCMAFVCNIWSTVSRTDSNNESENNSVSHNVDRYHVNDMHQSVNSLYFMCARLVPHKFRHIHLNIRAIFKVRIPSPSRVVWRKCLVCNADVHGEERHRLVNLSSPHWTRCYDSQILTSGRFLVGYIACERPLYTMTIQFAVSVKWFQVCCPRDTGLRRYAAVLVWYEVRHTPADGYASSNGVSLRRSATQGRLLPQAADVRRQAGRSRHLRKHGVPLRRWGRRRPVTRCTASTPVCRPQRPGAYFADDVGNSSACMELDDGWLIGLSSRLGNKRKPSAPSLRLFWLVL